MSETKQITIFLVDDNALYLKNLELTFSSKPYYNVQTFATGELCLEQLHQKPDIIVLDYYLNSISKQAINGLETLIQIRALDQQVPVIMLSEETSAEVAANCMKHRANEFIIKGDISFARLREIITTIFIDKQGAGNIFEQIGRALLSIGF
jgi:two-component system OmpR family response regulator